MGGTSSKPKKINTGNNQPNVPIYHNSIGGVSKKITPKFKLRKPPGVNNKMWLAYEISIQKFINNPTIPIYGDVINAAKKAKIINVGKTAYINKSEVERHINNASKQIRKNNNNEPKKNINNNNKNKNNNKK